MYIYIIIYVVKLLLR